MASEDCIDGKSFVQCGSSPPSPKAAIASGDIPLSPTRPRPARRSHGVGTTNLQLSKMVAACRNPCLRMEHRKPWLRPASWQSLYRRPTTAKSPLDADRSSLGLRCGHLSKFTSAAHRASQLWTSHLNSCEELERIVDARPLRDHPWPQNEVRNFVLMTLTVRRMNLQRATIRPMATPCRDTLSEFRTSPSA
jgi:hypothetical protein